MTIYPWQHTLWSRLTKLTANNNLPQALLFNGESGIGKSRFVHYLAAWLLCEQTNPDTACGHCQSCRSLQADAHPDFMSIYKADDKQQILVNQIRELIQFSNLTRSMSSYRVIIIEEIELMNTHAANSLLKTLEEPAPNTCFLLTTHQKNRLLPTIISRTQMINMVMPDTRTALDWLNSLTEHNEGADNNQNTIKLALAQGKPVKAAEITQDDLDTFAAFKQGIINIHQRKASINAVIEQFKLIHLQQLIDWQILLLNQLSKRQQNLTEDNPLFDHDYLLQFKLPSVWKLYDEILTMKLLVHTSVNAQGILGSMLHLWQEHS